MNGGEIPTAVYGASRLLGGTDDPPCGSESGGSLRRPAGASRVIWGEAHDSPRFLLDDAQILVRVLVENFLSDIGKLLGE
jgi:hypothetical protein